MINSVGAKAERRTKNGASIASIVRFNVSQNQEDSTKIMKTTACITDVVPPGKTQNVKARKLADSASAKPCDEFEG